MADNSGRPVAECERLFITEQPAIRAAIIHAARRYRLSLDEVDELTSEVAVKLIEDDYAVLRKFQGRSSLRTYLTVVIQRVVLDSRIAKWGKWRPSAQSKRMGSGAVLFERLCVQTGLSFEAACDAVERAGGERIDRGAFERLAARLSTRMRRRAVPLEDVAHAMTAPADPASALLDECHRLEFERVATALAREIEALPPVDRVLIQRRFFENTSIASLARDTHQDQKALYRRMARLLGLLRARLERHGVTHLSGAREPEPRVRL